MLAQSAPHINYVGYVEGRDINHGKADVVVTDGFTGNVALKTMEGFASFLLGNLREVFANSMRGTAVLPAGAQAFARDARAVRSLRIWRRAAAGRWPDGRSSRMAPPSPRAIRNALRAAANESLGDALSDDIVELLGKMSATIPSRMAGKGIRAIFGRMRERLHLRGKEGEWAGRATGIVEAGPRAAQDRSARSRRGQRPFGELTVAQRPSRAATGGLNGAAPTQPAATGNRFRPGS